MKLRILRQNCRAAGCALALLGTGFAQAAETKDARAYYNDGVQQLAKLQLREAESSLRLAVQSNQAVIQPVALYNLGHVRFAQGQETLKGGVPDREALMATADSTSSFAEQIIRQIAPLVLSEDVNTLVGAYMDARATRKRIRLSRDELRRELDILDSAVGRWRRSVSDFRSAHELDPTNTDAAFNADVVQRRIDELEKYRKRLTELQEILIERRAKLTEMMKEMRGKIPKDRQRESDDEESDEDEEPEEPKDRKEPMSSKSQQQQRIGGERELDPDLLRVLKEKTKTPTMQFGQDMDNKPPPAPGDKEGDKEGGLRQFIEGSQKERPPTRRGRDW